MYLPVAGQELSLTNTNDYDGHGNLRSKDNHTYLYGDDADQTGSVHQLTRRTQGGAVTDSLTYDANGNMTHAGQQRTIRWNTFNKPSHISKIEDSGFEQTVSYLYNTGHQRAVQRMKFNATWYYDGGMVEHYQHHVTHKETYKYFLVANGQKIGYIVQSGEEDDGGGPIISSRSTTETAAAESIPAALARTTYSLKTYYLLNDHLGSPQVVVDSNGQALENLSFSAWGERRAANFDPNGTVPHFQTLLDNYALTHGFTGHEQDDFFGLINMKGRLYDAKLGRFLSADPFVQAPDNTQSYNRYSYVLNNPLSYTDPSGYNFVKKFYNAIRTVVAIGVTILTAGAGLPVIIAANALSGFALTYAATGSLEAAVSVGIISGVSAGLSAGLAGAVRTYVPEGLFRNLAHGVAQGTVSLLQGGKFKHGFLSAFASHATRNLGKYLKLGSPGDGNPTLQAGRTVLAAVIGGTVSERTGGKFANGAVTAAFVHLFNAEGMLYKERKYYGPVEDVDLAADLAKNQYKIGVGVDVRIGDSASVSGGAIFGGGRGFRLYFATSEGVGLLGLEGHIEVGMATPGNANVPGGFEGAAHSFEINVAAPKFTAVEFGGANSILDPDSHFIQFEIGSPTAAGGGYQESYTRSRCIAFCP